MRWFSKLNQTSSASLVVPDWRASPSGARFAKPIEEMSKEELNTCLKYFYTSARKQDGSHYKASSLKTIRAAIDRYLRKPPHCKQFSIVSDAAFREANTVLFAFVKDLKKSGKIAGVVHKKAITKGQLKKLFDSGQLGPANSQDPAQLQRTVWFYLGLYFGRRGRENQRDLKSGMLVLKNTIDGEEYFELNRQMPPSLSPINARDKSDAKVVFSVVGSSRCPVATIKNYLSHLNPLSDVLFQRRSRKFSPRGAIWYGPSPVGRNALEHFMREMSKRAGIEPYLTKTCLRATALSIISPRSNSAMSHTLKAETADASNQALKSNRHPPGFQPKCSSTLLSNYLEGNEGLCTRINPPVEPTVIATMIEIEQQQNSDGEIVFQVRKIPIVAGQHNQVDVSVSIQ